MKKLLSFAAALAISVGAYTLNLHTGWQLKGALSDINVNELNSSDIISVWTYDSINKKWRAYLPNSSINLSKYGIENLQKIEEGEGFWVNAKNNSSINVGTLKYPLTTFIGKVWGYNWYKIDAFYDGDKRFEGNDVEVNDTNEYILLRAYKKDNQDSRAQISTPLPNIKGFNAEVNLVYDNIYSLFQVLAISKDNINISHPMGDIKNTSGLTFVAALSIRKNSIYYWWDIEDPISGKYYEGDVGGENYNEDLTNLVQNGSDIKVQVISDNGKITYKVYNEANGNVIFEKSLNLSDTNITNFKGFNIASFRSRVKDNVANKNGEEAIDKSENVINNFDVIKNIQISSLTDFINNLGFTPLEMTDNDFNNKLILNDDSSIIFFNNDGTYKEIDDDGKTDEGNWSVQNNILVMNQPYNNILVAVKNKNGSLITVKGYDSEDGWWNDESAILNANENTTVNSTNDYLALFYSNTPIDNINDSDFTGKTLLADKDINEIISFNNDGTFTDSWKENGQNYSKDGNWSINNNVLVLDYNSAQYGGVKKAFVVFIDNKQKIIYILVDSNGKIVGGGVDTVDVNQ